MSYDPKCYDLALEFLEDEGVSESKHGSRRAGGRAIIAHLAQTIQSAIECEIEDIRSMLTREVEQ